jgi:hypothetical protein
VISWWCGLISICFSTAAVTCFAQESSVPAPVADKYELFHKYVETTLGLDGAIGATFSSALQQWRDAPPEWRAGGGGYAKRWASAYAESAIGDTTKYAVARMLHQDPSYQRCECTDFGPRLRHALGSTFMARNREGAWVLSPATAAGIAAANVVPAITWYPHHHGARDGLVRAGSGVLAKMGVRVLREFFRLPRPSDLKDMHTP